MVGKSESIDLSTNLFVPFNKKFKNHVRKKNIGVASLPALSPRLARNQSGTFELPINHKVSFNGSKKKTATTLSNLETSIDRVLLKEFIPANVTINYKHGNFSILKGRRNFIWQIHPVSDVQYPENG